MPLTSDLMTATAPAAGARGPRATSASHALDRVPTGLALLIVSLIGGVVRLLLSGEYRLEGTDCDGAAYMELARHIASGSGFTTGIHKFLFMTPPHLPQPDSHWSPLYPLLTGIAFRLGGESLETAKRVPLMFGIAVPGLVYALARTLVPSRAVALVAGLAAALHPTLVTLSPRIETEIGTIALVTLAFVLLPRQGRWSAIALGVVLGLAYLMKYQSVLLWPAVLLHRVLARGARAGLRGAVPVLAAFAVTIAPWLIRNALMFGSPFYTDLQYDALSGYAFRGGLDASWTSLEPPPATLRYLLGHPGEVAHHVIGALRLYAASFPHDAAIGALPAGLALVGAISARREVRAWAPVALYAAVLLTMFCVSTPSSRYLFSLIPFLLVLAAAGAIRMGALVAAWFPRANAAAEFLGLVVAAAWLIASARTGVAWAADRVSVWNPHVYHCVVEHLAAAAYLRAHTAPGDAIMSTEPFHAAYLYDRPAVNMPYGTPAVARVRDAFGIRYLVLADRDREDRVPEWKAGPPPWAEVAWREERDDLARRSGAEGYTHLSGVTVYRFRADSSRASPGGAAARGR